MKKLTLLLFLLLPLLTRAQEAAIRQWQQHYKEEFLTDAHSPLTSTDTGFLRFFDYNPYCVYRAKVRLMEHGDTISLATHSGTIKKYRIFAEIRFSEKEQITHYPHLPKHTFHNAEGGRIKKLRLYLYQSIDFAKNPAYADYLFLPFNDLTNGIQTYGGGRYLDFKLSDIKDGRILLDFNKAYNPYCAFKDGYSCPIPPVENRLDEAIYAGEKLPAPPLLHSE